jgi:hypothetical protein
LKNEKGYALVLVLVIITITFTFALSMSGMALSARKQFNKTDEVNKATDIAEMGIGHYEALLANIVWEANVYAETQTVETIKKNGKSKGHAPGKNKQCKDNKPRCTPEYDEFFYQKLDAKIKELNNNLSRTVEGSNSYEVTNISLSSIKADDTIDVNFTSNGKTKNEIKTLKSVITIEKNGESLVGEPKPSPSSYTHKEALEINLKGQDKHITYDSSVYFEKSIHIQGNRLLKVNGNAFFKDHIQFLGTADIIVSGDAIFTYPPDFNGKAYSFCVYGNTYLINNKGELTEYSLPSGKNKSCPKPNDDEWYINPDEGVEVEY